MPTTRSARKTSWERSGWQTIEDYLGRRWGNIELDLADQDPGTRDRMVVTNSRLKNAADVVRVFADPAKAPHLVEDLELTQVDDNGELGEGPERKRTHISDSLAYLLFQRFGSPVTGRRGVSSRAMEQKTE